MQHNRIRKSVMKFGPFLVYALLCIPVLLSTAIADRTTTRPLSDEEEDRLNQAIVEKHGHEPWRIYNAAVLANGPTQEAHAMVALTPKQWADQLCLSTAYRVVATSQEDDLWQWNREAVGPPDDLFWYGSCEDADLQSAILITDPIDTDSLIDLMDSTDQIFEKSVAYLNEVGPGVPGSYDRVDEIGLELLEGSGFVFSMEFTITECSGVSSLFRHNGTTMELVEAYKVVC